MVQVRGPLSLNLVEQALRNMQQRHAILRSYFTDSSKKADYLATDDVSTTLPLTIVPRQSGNQWKEVIEKSSMTLFTDLDSHLWRVFFLQAADITSEPSEVIVTFHHAIADGISVGWFCSEFIDQCISIYNNSPLKLTEFPIIPPVEELLAKKLSWAGFLWGSLKSTVRFLKYKKHLNRYERLVPIPERKPKNVYRVIDIGSLVARCRENNVTLTALLTAALTRAVHNVTRTDNAKGVQIQATPVNVRERCNPPVDKARIGYFVDCLETAIAFDRNTSIWDMARSYRKQLMDGLENGGHMPTTFSKPITFKLFSSLGKGMFEQTFPYGVGVTNIGMVNLKAHQEPFSIEYFTLCTNRVWGDWMILLHVATIENAVYLCFGFAEPLVSTEKMELIADQVVNILSSVE